MKFVNYAHRGASEYAPENTMLAFCLGIFMGANGIETDVQLTRDGVPVLFHDNTLARVTGEVGSVFDYTYAELLQFRVHKNGLTDQILSLEDFLKHFSFRDMTFAIELKQKGTAKPVADMIRAYGVQRRVVVTSFDFDELCAMREYAPELETGFLAKAVDDALLTILREKGIVELCPPADQVTAENVRYWHDQGFRVRAWGVKDEALMRNARDCGADGMTVNFPDKLTEYLNAK